MVPLLLSETANTSVKAVPQNDTSTALGGDSTFVELLADIPIAAVDGDVDLGNATVEIDIPAPEDMTDEHIDINVFIASMQPTLRRIPNAEQGVAKEPPKATNVPVEKAVLPTTGERSADIEPDHPKSAQIVFEGRAFSIVSNRPSEAPMRPNMPMLAVPADAQKHEIADLEIAMQTPAVAFGNTAASPASLLMQASPRLSDLEPDRKPIPDAAIIHPAQTTRAAVTVQPETRIALVQPEPIEVAQLSAIAPERAAHVQQQSLTSQPPLQHGETVRQVANQMAVAITDRAGRPTEISLNPEELGRVRLMMSAVDTAITVTITAERQETNDLLRRHIETLAQEFKELGYNDISFSFGQRENSQQTAPDSSGGMDDPPTEGQETDAPRPTKLTSAGGLDIKV